MSDKLSSCTERALDTWAAQKREMLLHAESVTGVLGKIRDEREAAGAGEAKRRQRWAEVYRGDGLIVQMIIATLKELPRLTLTFHYVLRRPWRVPIERQAAEIGIAKREYWRQLYVGEACVDAGLQLLANTQKVTE